MIFILSIYSIKGRRSIVLKEGDLFVCESVCLSGYAFRRALTYGADICQVGRGQSWSLGHGISENVCYFDLVVMVTIQGILLSKHKGR